MDVEIEILKLREELKKHNHFYYVLDAPKITDGEYDALMHKLKSLEAQYPELIDTQSPSVVVGGNASLHINKVRHGVQMDSLQDVFNLESVFAFCDKVREKFNNQVLFVVEPKIDGLSVALEYKNGVLVRAATRGNGFVGEDVTQNIRMIKTVPQTLAQKIENLVVRGEVFMPNLVFEQLINVQRESQRICFKNARNAAAGSLRQKDPQITKERNLDILIFNLQQITTTRFESHKESIEFLKNLGFNTVDVYGLFKSNGEIAAQIERIKQEVRSFNIDGAVVKVDDLGYRRELGRTSKYPKWAVAFKYTPQEVQTTIRDIKVSVGRTGALTPIAIFDPVFISGSVVSRAVLHNQDFIKKKKINIGSLIRVRKAGDVIPEIMEAVVPSGEYFEIPSNCPSCGEKLFAEEGGLICQNVLCPDVKFRKLTHFVSRDAMNIEGLGPSIIKKLIEQKVIVVFADIYYLEEQDFASIDGLAEKSIQNILKSIEKSKGSGPARLLFGLGIKNIGEKTSKDIIRYFGSVDNLFGVTMDEICEIRGIGVTSADSLANYFKLQETKTCIHRLKIAGVQTKVVQSQEVKETGETFVITGSFEGISRHKLVERLQGLGINVSDTISKKTNCLLVGENPGSKLKKAEQLGVKIVLENELRNLIKKLEMRE
ncbi:MAG: NAD-dependent DNA ligase LigA [Oscillospiraceae bacterium]|jgi:DNA ligase (NAD+)|nr:NAD-dependent DNA ligase LigA [Oscillospiraceae bacterium]